MEYRLLGRTGVKVSQLCFGTMSFGDIADEAESEKMFKRCLDLGINFFDCANVYAGGRSEEILGDLMKGMREDLVITTKVATGIGDDINRRGSSRRHIQREVENSLRRLQTDHIDVYFLHHFDKNTPVEETVATMDDLIQQGKILYWAVSNWSAWQTMKAVGISAATGQARLQCLQPMYNLVKRQAEVEILPMAQSEGIGVIPYSPLGGGLLTGKYINAKPEKGRLVDSQMYAVRYGEEMYHEIAADFVAHAKDKGISPVTLAVAWVMANPAVTAPIIGARNLNQLEDSLAALDVDMTPEWYTEIANLSYTPPPAHDRLEETKSA